MTIDENGLMPARFEESFGIAKLQRQVWFPASEIDAVLEGPGWID